MSWSATAPSNIALIKYMGKVDVQPPNEPAMPPVCKRRPWLALQISEKDKTELFFKNLSLNPSMSYTLDHFITKVRLEESSEDRWSPFKTNPFEEIKLYSSNKNMLLETLAPSAQKRFLDFFKFLKRCFKIPGYYKLSSQNNFPLALGAASSASSFSALTRTSFQLALDRSPLKDQLKKMGPLDLAEFSRTGSGSSCRSFFSPWCIWEKHRLSSFKNPYSRLDHQLLVVDLRPKRISSRQAHKIVKTSPCFKGRPERAEKRLTLLRGAFRSKDWERCFQICYEEFSDMHSLFETSIPPLIYQTGQSRKALECIQSFWKERGEGPLVTMDAGSSIHLLYRPDQKKIKEELTNQLSDYVVLSSL